MLMWCNDNIYWYMEDTIIKSYDSWLKCWTIVLMTELNRVDEVMTDWIDLRWRPFPIFFYADSKRSKSACFPADAEVWSEYVLYMYYVVQYIYVCVTSICILYLLCSVDCWLNANVIVSYICTMSMMLWMIQERMQSTQKPLAQCTRDNRIFVFIFQDGTAETVDRCNRKWEMQFQVLLV